MHAQTPRPASYLNRFASNLTSQCGEDGIINHVLEIIGEPRGWCVEFGAWDGKHLSNTYQLIRDHHFSAVLIEADARKFQELLANYADNVRVHPRQAFVGFDTATGLDNILGDTAIPHDFDVLSIDIDGNDYHVWEVVEKYRPRVVVIEFNATIPTSVEFVQPRDMDVAQGCSLLSLCRLAKRKGYELVATTMLNAIFVDQPYFSRFGITDNSPAALRADESLLTYLFQGYDGTIFVEGCQRLAWHDVNFDASRFQQLPRLLRKYPPRLGKWARQVLKWYQRKRNAA